MSDYPDGFNDRVLDGPSNAFLSTEEGVIAALAAQDKAFAEAFAKHPAGGDDLSDALWEIDRKLGDFIDTHAGYNGADHLYDETGIDLADYRKGFSNIVHAYSVL